MQRPVTELARVLQQVVREREVSIVPEQINNVLIVRAPEADLETIDALLRELNRPAARITLSFTLLEVDEAVDVRNADPAELLRKLSAENTSTRIREIRLTSLENQLAQVQLGEQRTVAAGASFSRAGERINTYQQEEFGTILTMTARVGEDGRIVVEVSFEMSRLDESIGATESADDLYPAKRTVTLRSTVSVPDGEMVLLTDFDSQDSPGETRLIGILSASSN